MRHAIRSGFMVLGLAFGSSIPIATPGISIGINVPAYPQLVAVPGHPVYYAPQLPANDFK